MSYYDPNHPDADWSGYVAVSSRKHVPEPKRGDEAEWKPNKRIALKSNDSSTLNLIGGPVPKDDPSTLGSSNWQSEAQAASVRTKTTVDQLTETGRSQIRYKNKKLGLRASSLKSGNDTVAASLSEDPYYILETEDKPLKGREIAPLPLSNDTDLNFVGYRQITKTSLLECLGKDLYASSSLVDKQRSA
eukprot:scaffold5672_cov142-Skeletonema_menzelii.AAC.4